MELRGLIWKVLLENIDQNILNLKNKYVGEGKPISEEDFNKLIEVTNNKFYLLSWLTKKVGQGIIKPEDIYKYKEYFEIFEKNKNKFQHKDIHLYKTPEDVKNFLSQVISIREADVVFDEIEGKDNYVPQNEIEKLEATEGIKYLGMYDDGKFKYQVFQIFGVNQNTWKTYRDILGKCKGRNKGAKIDICTIANYNYFKDYLKQDKGSSYFLLYNLDDPKSPYQLHYESGQFMDKNDNSAKINQLKFFGFVGERIPKYSLDREDFQGQFEIPVKGKGKMDSRGRRQGLWADYSKGKVESIQNWVNGHLKGPFIVFSPNGKIQTKGNHLDPWTYIGPYESFQQNGEISEKGEYNSEGKKIGLWIFKYRDHHNQIVDFSKTPLQMSGFTKQNKLRFVSDAKFLDSFAEPRGKITFFNQSGNIESKGRISANKNSLGKWTYYAPNGSIRAQGLYRGGYRSGSWKDVVELTNGQKVTLVANFLRNYPEGKISVYNSKGELIKKVSSRNITPEYYWNRLHHSFYSFRDI